MSDANTEAPVGVFFMIMARWGVKSDRAMAYIMGISAGDLRALKADHARSLSIVARDRLRLALQIYQGIFSLFQNANNERRFIVRRQEKLDDMSILRVMMNDISRARHFVDWMSGLS